MTLSSNQIPKYNINFDPSPYVTHPSAGDFTKTIVLKGKDLNDPITEDRVTVSYLIYALEKTIHFKLKTLHVTCLERVVEEIVRAVRALVA